MPISAFRQAYGRRPLVRALVLLSPPRPAEQNHHRDHGDENYADDDSARQKVTDPRGQHQNDN